MIVTQQRRGRVLRAVGWHAALILMSIIVLVPVILLLLGSFKSNAEFLRSPFGWPKSFDFSNYTQAWSHARISTTLVNSIIDTVTAVVLSTILAAFAAYGLARYKFALNGLVRTVFLLGLIVPIQLIILPFFVVMRDVGLLQSRVGLIVAYTVFNLPLGILVMTPFFAALPGHLEEAASLDGASHLTTLFRVMLPLMRPAIASVIILNGVWIWNDFFIALVMAINPAYQTLPVGIMSFYGTYSTSWGLIFASVSIATLPLIIAYIFLSRQFIAGLTAGAVKG
jgi:raffinose/stachyose/melibiose transport system permease protein